MPDPRHAHDPAASDEIEAFIIDQIKDGADQDAIVTHLVAKGVEREAAAEVVGTLYPAIIEAANEQAFTPRALLPAALGGALAAVVGGAAWGLIVLFTGYELGIAAWGIGLLAGGAVVLFARGKRGLPLQALAVASGVGGILIGKYLSFYFILKDAIAFQEGDEFVTEISILSLGVFESFIDNASFFFGGFDLLWIGLAVVTAWRIPQGMGISLRPHLRT